MCSPAFILKAFAAICWNIFTYVDSIVRRKIDSYN